MGYCWAGPDSLTRSLRGFHRTCRWKKLTPETLLIVMSSCLFPVTLHCSTCNNVTNVQTIETQKKTQPLTPFGRASGFTKNVYVCLRIATFCLRYDHPLVSNDDQKALRAAQCHRSMTGGRHTSVPKTFFKFLAGTFFSWF